MTKAAALSQHIHEFYEGNNWTWSSLREHVNSVSWKDAVTQVDDCNTIAVLVYHITYYIKAVTDRIAKRPSHANQSMSLTHPPIESEEDWQQLVNDAFRAGDEFATLVKGLAEADFDLLVSEEHGSYYRNIQGVLEHNYYHLGQIVLLKKLIPYFSNSKSTCDGIHTDI